MEKQKCRYCKKYGLNFYKQVWNYKRNGKVTAYPRYVCCECNTKIMRKYRQTENGKIRTRIAVAKSIKKHKLEQDARVLMNMALGAKKIKKPNKCSICKVKKELQGHHPDYSKPLEVIWLCITCHSALHRNLV